ncbi:MAG: energy-coupling factor transporter transmembrane component T [Clostridia bacterium]
MPKFNDFHPLTNLSFFLFAVLLTISTAHPIILTASLLLSLVYDYILRGKTSIKMNLIFVLPTVILIILINFIFSHHGVTTLFTSESGVNYTLESLVTGVVTAVKFSAIVVWFFALSVILNEEKIIFLFGRVSPKIALVISMSLRFMPLMLSQYEQIAQAQKGLGKAQDNKKIIKKIKQIIRNISILITWQLERAIETSNSMTARGYGLKGKTKYNKFKFTGADFTFINLYLVSLCVYLAARFKGGLFAFYTPIIMISHEGVFSVLAIALFIAVCLSPIFIDSRKQHNDTI